MKSFRKRKPIQIKKEKYIAEYRFADALVPFSNVHLKYDFIEKENNIICDLIFELKYWINKYEVPIIAMAFSQDGNLITLSSKRESYITGYKNNKGVLVFDFGSIKFPEEQTTEIYFENKYKNIPYETSQDIEKRVIQERKKIEYAIKFYHLIWVIVVILIPLSWAIAGLFYDIVSFLSTLSIFTYSLYRLLKHFEIIKKARWEIEKEEIENRKNHYYHHCEKNPNGFIRLRNENWVKKD